MTMINYILGILEKYSSVINCWAWNKRWSKRDPNEWIKGYNKWKKDKK